MPDNTKTEAPKEIIWLGRNGQGEPEAFDPVTGKRRELTIAEQMQVNPLVLMRLRSKPPEQGASFEEMPWPGKSFGEVVAPVVPVVPAIVLMVVVSVLIRTNPFAKKVFIAAGYLFTIVLFATIIRVAIALLALGRAM